MYEIHEQNYVTDISSNIPVVLGADIGGTNANIGIFDMTVVEKPRLLFSLHGKSHYIVDFTEFMIQIMNRIYDKNLRPRSACFGVAGVISADSLSCKPTNAPFTVDVAKICRLTALDHCYLVNDFQIIGYGLAQLNPSDIVLVKRGTARPSANKIIIGAGTGLGKSILHWEPTRNLYVPVVSEGGHADLSAQTPLEFDLITYIQQTERRSCAISWEDVLSGNGIRRIFSFFCARLSKKKLDGSENAPHPDEIFHARNENVCSKYTFQLFSTFYARCAKNFCLDALGLGGVYIAGGIAAKNVQLFQQLAFKDEFINCGKLSKLLRQVPIFVISDYNVSLYGAVEYMKHEGWYSS